MGVDANDVDDAVSGPNAQNYPVLAPAQGAGTTSAVSGTLNSMASETFDLDFYASPSCDPSGNGEGLRYLGSTSATIDAGGDATFGIAGLGVVHAGEVVTATATDADGDTSEFSACRPVTILVAPDAPTAMAQFAADGATAIAVGGSTMDTTVVLKGTVSDPEAQQVALEVEVKPLAMGFDGTGLLTGNVVASGSTSAVSVPALTPGTSYHWRARTVDADSATSAWVSFGANAETAADFTLTVDSVNDAPVAVNDSYSTDEDTTLNVTAPGVLGNDSDIDSATITAVQVSGPTHGTLILNADGSFSYSPALNYNGPHSFTYKANDGTVDSNTATVSLTVTAVNDAPTFTAGGNVPVAEDSGSYSAAWATNLSKGAANDGGQVLDFVAANSNVGLFSAGPSFASNGTLAFTPAANANGSATLTVQLHDNGGTDNGGHDTSAPVTFTITVTAVQRRADLGGRCGWLVRSEHHRWNDEPDLDGRQQPRRRPHAHAQQLELIASSRPRISRSAGAARIGR